MTCHFGFHGDTVLFLGLLLHWPYLVHQWISIIAFFAFLLGCFELLVLDVDGWKMASTVLKIKTRQKIMNQKEPKPVRWFLRERHLRHGELQWTLWWFLLRGGLHLYRRLFRWQLRGWENTWASSTIKNNENYSQCTLGHRQGGNIHFARRNTGIREYQLYIVTKTSFC